MRKRLLATMLTGLAAVSVLGFSVAEAQPAQSRAPQCFFSHDWSAWKATPDAKSIYIRVGVKDIWRLDLSGSCPALEAPNARLITEQRGSSSICSALDIDLKVSDGTGFATPCIVSNLTPLSPSEASELPKNLRP